ncbi:DUF3982 domain-containing protein [Antarcticibacterium arcticum]|uniref:DUF3982 domain-containing protein n=1 Tax=Antarcticibacterium arcticum TaxID=2585771 RepID=A0A5B8YQT3_9FLAO|nr:DUF3982 domain-containing protein [Antarcticibacterium arcticum]
MHGVSAGVFPLMEKFKPKALVDN